MQEKQITTEVLSLLYSNPAFKSCAVEVKLTKTDRFYVKKLQEHQRGALSAVKNGKLVFKIPDFGARNPFDLFMLNKADAFVCIVFYQPRVLKEAVFISIEVWNEKILDRGVVSLTLDEAKELGRSFSL